MPKKFRDANGISHYASDGSVVPISKFARGYPKSNARVFGGEVAVDIERMPTRLQRARLLKIHGKQLSVPQHQDLIRLNGSPPKITDVRANQFEDIYHSGLIRIS